MKRAKMNAPIFHIFKKITLVNQIIDERGIETDIN